MLSGDYDRTGAGGVVISALAPLHVGCEFSLKLQRIHYVSSRRGTHVDRTRVP